MMLKPVTSPSAALVLVLSLAGSGVAAQQPGDSLTLARIREEGFQRSQVLATATALSDLYGPRLAGSSNYRIAAEWARSQLSRWGLSRAVLEPWGKRGVGWSLERFSVEMITPRYLHVTAVPKAWSRPIRSRISGAPILVDIQSPDDFAKYHGKLSGAIVMNGGPKAADHRFDIPAYRYSSSQLDSLAGLTDPGSPATYWEEDDEWQQTFKRQRAFTDFYREEGVVAVLTPSSLDLGVRVQAYASYGSDPSGNIPAFVVAREHYDQIARLVERKIPVQLELTLQTRFVAGDSTGYNLVAELSGSDPAVSTELVMLGGHLDSWHAGTGATDNAAGCAASMEAMRILQAVGAKPRRTIRLACWDGEEEEDYFGSMGYVKRHFGDPVTMTLKPEQALVSGYFNMDEGTGRIRGVYLQGNEATRPVLAPLFAPFADLDAATLSIANTGSTDHMPFRAVGIPAFKFIQDPIDYDTRTHHTSLDVADYLLEDDLKQAAVVMAGVVYQVANLPEKLPRPALPEPKKKD